jgi:hypothetical protein
LKLKVKAIIGRDDNLAAGAKCPPVENAWTNNSGLYGLPTGQNGGKTWMVQPSLVAAYENPPA